jgi:hypothetical protein
MERDEISKIENFLNEANLILKDFKNLETNSNSVNYLIDCLFRTYDVLNSIEKIVKGQKSLRSFEHPIGILLRSGLSDFIHNQHYLNKCISNGVFDAEKFEYEISEYICAHFKRIDPSLEPLAEYKAEIGIEELRLKENKKYKEIKIFSHGMNTAKEKKLNYLETAVECWEWYSKYEHYGFFTKKMLLKFEDNLLRIHTSINLLYVSFYFSLLTLFDIDNNLFELKKANEIQRLILEKKNNAINQPSIKSSKA